ncbi:MAG: vWA domain-containing protein [Oscillospiraceae bacterium]
MKKFLGCLLVFAMAFTALSTGVAAAANPQQSQENSHLSEPVIVAGTAPEDYPSAGMPGFVSMKKSAKWTDKAAGFAEISFEVYGVPTGIDVLLVLDRSGSMDKPVPNSAVSCNGRIANNVCQKCGKKWPAPSLPTCSDTDRLAIAQAAAVQFAGDMLAADSGGNPSNSRVGLITFSGLSGSPETDAGLQIVTTTRFFSAAEQASLISSINTLEHRGGTNYTSALNAAKNMINSRTDVSRPVCIIFLTDGIPEPKNEGIEVAAELRGMNIKIYSIALAISDTDIWNKGAKPLLQNSIAFDPSCYYDVVDANGINAVFKDIAKNIKNAGTDAVLTDIINSKDFVIDQNRPITANGMPAAGFVTASGFNVEWRIGNILQDKATLSIPIRLEPNKDGVFPTNDGNAKLAYTNFKGNTKCLHEVATPILSKSDAKFSITYIANAPAGTTAVGTVPIDSKAYGLGDKATVLTRGNLAVAGYKFTNWSTGKAVFAEGAEVNVTENLTFAAMWEKDDSATLPYTVKYFKDDVDMNADVSGTVWLGNPIVTAAMMSYANMPANYELDTAKSTALPFVVKAEEHQIKVFYKKIPVAPAETKLTVSHYYYTNNTLDGSLLGTTPGFGVGSHISFSGLTVNVWNGNTYQPDRIDVEKSTPAADGSGTVKLTRFSIKPGESLFYEKGSTYKASANYCRTVTILDVPKNNSAPNTGDSSPALTIFFLLLAASSAFLIKKLINKLKRL